ncbi:putative F-box protein At2g02030 [Lolium rigidum]|uniref:putative F-box protein At2g02030 n=1 Tax=Lolium rigidum TaxID=89674 RepID=UPI001F5DFFF8|nr:putative F-box protein At2g02030 [Lolium rigidum]
MLLRSGRRIAAQEEAGRPTVPRRRRRKKARSDLLAAFPEEIQQEILARLPPKSLLRCRAVCRSWRRLASDPAFLLHHHRHQPRLQLISTCRTAGANDGYVRRLEAFHLRAAEARRPVFGFPNHFASRYSRFPVTASCDGLLVVGRYSICNPATRQWGSLSTNPKLHIERIVGLFRHQPSGEYRVLYWTHSSMPYALPILPTEVPCPNEYRVLTVGTSESRLVDCPLAQMIGELGPIICGAPVLLNGTLHVHWTMRSTVRYHKILVFDTVAETFRHMVPPSVNPRHAMHLLDMCGRLAVATSKDRVTGMSIFILQDEQKDVWAFHYRIKMPVMDIRRFQEQGNLWAEVVSDEGDVLVCCYGYLLHCDKNGKLVASFNYDDDLPVVLPHRLKESLIQHTFFNKTES